MTKKKLIIIISLVVVLLLSSLFIYLSLPKIRLNGDKIINLELGNKYNEKGYKVDTIIGKLKNKVSVKGNVDENHLGSYKINYEIKFLIFKLKKTRVVNIVDTIKPVITLEGNISVNVCPNKAYEEDGYKAEDNYDGDITLKVNVQKSNDKYIYTVKDSSNNETVVTRNINYIDDLSPILTLNGNSTTYVYVGNSYNEQGAKAIDNCDLDISNKIEISGNVNTSTIGTYTVTYKIKDSSNNESNITRTVKVINKTNYSNSTIYLTFDDGPSASTTPRILDILKEENVKATFFVIGVNDSLNSIIKRAYDEGHTIALHSYTHNYQTIYSSEEAYFNDLDKIADKVESITGERPKIVRFPGGTSNTVSRRYNKGIMTRLATEVTNRGYKYFDWNISSGDAGSVSTSDGVYNNVVAGLSNRATNIVLMHDIKTYTMNALRRIIQYGKEKGFNFDRITENTQQIKHKPQN